VDDLWATKSEDIGLIVRTLSYVVMIHQHHRQTNGQTDNMRSQDRTLHHSASRGKKQVNNSKLNKKF